MTTRRTDHLQDSLTWDSNLGKRELSKRLKIIREAMKRSGVGFMVVFTQPREFPATSGNVRYLSNWSGDRERTASMVLIPQEGSPKLVIDNPAMLPLARETSWIEEIAPNRLGFEEEAVARLKDDRIGRGTVGLVGSDEMPPDLYARFLKAFESFEITRTDDVVARARLTKSPGEVELLKRASEICDKALEAFKSFVRSGVTESEAILEMESVGTRLGAEASGCSIASGPHAGKYLTTPRFRKFQRGDTIIASAVFRYRGYWSQAIRTGSLGKPSPQSLSIFNLVSGAHDAAAKGLRPRNSVGKIHKMVWDVVSGSREEGMRHMHFTMGHGMGLNYSERPRLYFHEKPLDNEMSLEPGMTFELHPNLGVEDKRAGAARGDLYLVTESGPKSLTKPDSDFFQI